MEDHSNSIVKKGHFWKFLSMGLALLLTLFVANTVPGQELNPNDDIYQWDGLTNMLTGLGSTASIWLDYEIHTVDSVPYTF